MDIRNVLYVIKDLVGVIKMEPNCFGLKYMKKEHKECYSCNVKFSCKREFAERQVQDYLQEKRDNEKELIELKAKLHKELIELIAMEAHKRHLERMEFMMYQRNSMMTRKTRDELGGEGNLLLIENKQDGKKK